jgi:hypothetical protein
MIYSITTLDVAAHTNGAATPSYAAALPRVGKLGASVWRFLSSEPWVTLGSWGLPIFLWQATTNVLAQELLMGLEWGLPTRCAGNGLKFSFEYAGFYWVCPRPLPAHCHALLPASNRTYPCGPLSLSDTRSVSPLILVVSVVQGFHVLMAYLVAWAMNDDGCIGSLIHNAVKKLTPA